jgi:hypothetical protein
MAKAKKAEHDEETADATKPTGKAGILGDEEDKDVIF